MSAPPAPPLPRGGALPVGYSGYDVPMLIAALAAIPGLLILGISIHFALVRRRNPPPSPRGRALSPALSPAAISQATRDAAVQRSTRTALASLTVHAWKARISEESGAGAASERGSSGVAYESEECSICLQPFEEGELVGSLPCGHFFHTKCIYKWFTQKQEQPHFCPMCKHAPLHALAAADGETRTEERGNETGA